MKIWGAGRGVQTWIPETHPVEEPPPSEFFKIFNFFNFLNFLNQKINFPQENKGFDLKNLKKLMIIFLNFLNFLNQNLCFPVFWEPPTPFPFWFLIKSLLKSEGGEGGATRKSIFHRKTKVLI